MRPGRPASGNSPGHKQSSHLLFPPPLVREGEQTPARSPRMPPPASPASISLPALGGGGSMAHLESREQIMELGRLGVWAQLDGMTAAESLALARRIEQRGYGALWIPEGRGRNVLVHASFLLAGTSRLVVASGIANIYARDAMAAANGQRGLAEQSGGRFVLGL